MWIDLSIVLAFVIYSVSTGFIFRKKASQSLSEYFLAGRTLRGWQAGLSMAATQYAADTPLLVTGLIATAGIFSLWRLWVYAIAFLMMGFILGACWRRSGVLTDAEFTELRYGGSLAGLLRAVKALHLGTLVNCTILAMVLIAATRIAEPFLVWHEWLPEALTAPLANLLERWSFSAATLPPDHPEVWLRSADNLISIAFILFFTTLYSTTGGLRSVVATDVVQFAIAMAATACYAWIVVGRAGGLGAMTERLGTLYGSASRDAVLSFGPAALGETTLLFTAVLAVQWFAQVNADGTGYLAQRTMACRTDRDAKQAAVVFTFAQVVVRSLLWLPLALGLLLLYPAAEPPVTGAGGEAFRVAREATFASGIRDFLPAGIRGLMLTGMIAALASTVDTHLNWGSSYWANDLYKRFLMEKFLKRSPGGRELVWVARISNIGILAVAVLIMANLNSIQTAWHVSLLFGSGLGVVLILRWLWHRINAWSEIAAGFLSLVLAPVLLFGFPEMDEGKRLLIMLGLSTAGVFVVTFLTRPEHSDRLVGFYRRVHPPGFWAPVAELAGEAPGVPLRALAKSSAATLLASGSAFLFVVGIGSIVSGSYVDQGFGSSLAMIALGLVLVPIWGKLGFQEARSSN